MPGQTKRSEKEKFRVHHVVVRSLMFLRLQADIAPLMASLLGISYPMNSVVSMTIFL